MIAAAICKEKYQIIITMLLKIKIKKVPIGADAEVPVWVRVHKLSFSGISPFFNALKYDVS